MIPGKFTKTGKLRTVYILAKPLIEALSSWKALRINERAMLSEGDSIGELQGDSPLFLSKKGKEEAKSKDC